MSNEKDSPRDSNAKTERFETTCLGTNEAANADDSIGREEALNSKDAVANNGNHGENTEGPSERKAVDSVDAVAFSQNHSLDMDDSLQCDTANPRKDAEREESCSAQKENIEILPAAFSSDACLAAPFGMPVELLPNLYMVRIPLPHNPLKALNSYIVTGDETTTIIDVGFNHPDCEQALDRALAALGRSWESVEIVLTHSHPDHTGNLDRIYRKGMRVSANLHSFQEVENLQDMEANVFGPLLLQASTPDEKGITLENGKPRIHVSAELLPLKNQPKLTFLREGDELETGGFAFRVVEVPGHDPWHICLYEKTHKLMIIGDHVLERITPAISSWFPAYNALEKFLQSLNKMNDYDVEHVLPAHGAPFSDLRGRVAYLISHHEDRLDEIYGLVAAGHHDIVSISSNAKWRYDDWRSWPLDQKFFSMGETMAHLIYLVCEGKLKQTICGDEYRFELP